ncbi:uncharacterized protein Dwil_GK14024 [Drosophila willistoni]|uniref:Uncharacterized protein n=1 Tax=Drosophila willistoni TaxID=7260 RepID=B4NL28_DROWI|nr:retinoblastoma family protein [Drosophila willistoni]EDW84231.2 uncharacterized protein Dwil_GK14024 [Drosophila willistoni]
MAHTDSSEMSYIEEEIETEDDAEIKRVAQICEPLELSSYIKQNALDTYRRYNSDGGLLSADAQEWFCCSVYSCLQQAKMKDMRSKRQTANGDEQEVDTATTGMERTKSWNMSLTRLLRCFQMNMTKFLKRMEHWNWLTQQDRTFQQEIVELQRRMSITMIIQQHYQNIFNHLFVLPKDVGQEGDDGRSHYQTLYEFGWILFLVLRNELPSFVTENLVNGCQLLICVVELVYVNALEVIGSIVINQSFPGLPKDWPSPEFDSNKLDKWSALPSIMALMPELPEKGIRIMQKAFFQKSLMVLFMDQRLLGNDNTFRDLVKDGILEINLAALNRSYVHHIADISEMDERVLLCRKQGHQSEETKTETQISSSLIQLLDKKLPQVMPTIIVEALDKNSGNLLNELKTSLQNMGSQFGIMAKNCLNKQEAEARFNLASGLYYKLLKTIITSELELKPFMKITQLLEQPTFSSNFMACCLDLALYAYDEDSDQLMFPFVLSCYPDVDPYHFQKIPELVVRHHNSLLSRQLVKHLHLVEEKCLESLIFRNSSQFWKCFSSDWGSSLPSAKEVQHKKCFGEKENQPVASTTQGPYICLRKFYSLAHQRLTRLCQALYIKESYIHIWQLVEYSITFEGGKLIQQRHLDQLLLCAIHLHDRLTKERLNFSDIIQQYRRQPFGKSSVYRQVVLSEGRTGDIIAFYNQIYVKSVANYARKLLQSRRAVNTQMIRLKQTPLGHRAPLQEFTTTNVKRMCSNIFVYPPAMDRTFLKNAPEVEKTAVRQSPVQVPESSSTNDKLKRTNSEKELPVVIKRPNILRRSTSHE